MPIKFYPLEGKKVSDASSKFSLFEFMGSTFGNRKHGNL